MAPLGIPSLLGLIVAAASRVYLSIFDRLFLRYGQIGPRTRSQGTNLSSVDIPHH